ncbi:hypothetical protein DUI87_18843 [Hirundo rustica rustica]|uniref:Uncharacterized protein n=1 Tax=Hirundo rustica rustica TaxID=333673 RepID=A0A3M0JUA6_HIRRU|nr:hypothetical protein DUI87_18843 [Hirundo rustica rustica]
MVTAARLPQLQEPLDTAPGNAQAATLGLSVQGQGLDSMISLPLLSSSAPLLQFSPLGSAFVSPQALAELLGPGQELGQPQRSSLCDTTVQASIQIPKATSQKQTKMIVIESQGPEHENAKEIYEKFQKWRKLYFQEEENNSMGQGPGSVTFTESAFRKCWGLKLYAEKVLGGSLHEAKDAIRQMGAETQVIRIFVDVPFCGNENKWVLYPWRQDKKFDDFPFGKGNEILRFQLGSICEREEKRREEKRREEKRREEKRREERREEKREEKRRREKRD